MNSLEVEVDVNESYINRVYPQQPVEITLNAYPEDNYPAEVIAIIPAADRNKATVRVRVAFRQRDDRVPQSPRAEALKATRRRDRCNCRCAAVS